MEIQQLLTIERLIAFVASLVTIVGALAAYPLLLGRGSLRACRHKIRRVLSKMNSDGFTPEVLVCLGRGGFFVGSLVTDEMNRQVPVLGIDKAFFQAEASGGMDRVPKIEVPESFTLSQPYKSAKLLLVTGEVVDGGSMRAAAAFIKANVPTCELRTFALFWNTDCAFKPDYRGHEIRGRQRRIVWKKSRSPSISEFLDARKHPLGKGPETGESA